MLIWVWVIGWSYFSFRSPLTYNALYVNAIALLCLYARPQGGVVSPFFSVFSPFWVDGKQRTWSFQFFCVKTSAKTFFKELPMIVPGPLVLGSYFLWLQVLVVLGKPREVPHFEVCDEWLTWCYLSVTTPTPWPREVKPCLAWCLGFTA